MYTVTNYFIIAVDNFTDIQSAHIWIRLWLIVLILVSSSRPCTNSDNHLVGMCMFLLLVPLCYIVTNYLIIVNDSADIWSAYMIRSQFIILVRPTVSLCPITYSPHVHSHQLSNRIYDISLAIISRCHRTHHTIDLPYLELDGTCINGCWWFHTGILIRIPVSPTRLWFRPYGFYILVTQVSDSSNHSRLHLRCSCLQIGAYGTVH